jgi:hypothetical protein
MVVATSNDALLIKIERNESNNRDRNENFQAASSNCLPWRHEESLFGQASVALAAHHPRNFGTVAMAESREIASVGQHRSLAKISLKKLILTVFLGNRVIALLREYGPLAERSACWLRFMVLDESPSQPRVSPVSPWAR